MEPRFVILAAAVGIFFFALTAFVSSLVRSVRTHTEPEPVQELGEWPELPQANSGSVDTDLEGLETPVSPEAPSASVLTPLRVGSWQPPVEPATSERLGEVSLAERIATYLPPSPAAEPEPESQTARQPEPGPQPAPAPSPAPAPAPAPPPAPAPAPAPSPASAPAPAPSPAPVKPVAPAVNPELEQAVPVVVPAESSLQGKTTAMPVASASAMPAAVVRSADESSAIGPEGAGSATREPAFEWVDESGNASAAVDSVPESTAAPAPAPAPVPVPAAPAPPAAPATSAAAPVPAPAPAPAPPAPAPIPEPAPPVAPVSVPSPAFAAATVQEPASVSASVSEPLTPRPSSPAEAGKPRPAAVVRDSQSPQSTAASSQAAVRAERHRPRAHVRVELDESGGVPAALPERHLDAPLPHADSTAETFTMVAPVEMWFGDTRVGVKAGTKTYAQFRKYADVLLRDLKADSGRSRYSS